jgi:transposase
MSMGVHMKKKRRRRYTAEFKAETVKLVVESGRSISEIARDLGIPKTILGRWVKQAEVDVGRGPAGALTTAEREELARLRRDVRRLEMEREILKKATAFFAKESK